MGKRGQRTEPSASLWAPQSASEPAGKYANSYFVNNMIRLLSVFFCEASVGDRASACLWLGDQGKDGLPSLKGRLKRVCRKQGWGLSPPVPHWSGEAQKVLLPHGAAHHCMAGPGLVLGITREGL